MRAIHHTSPSLSDTSVFHAVSEAAAFYSFPTRRSSDLYTLTASSTGFAPVTSSAFDITPGKAAHPHVTTPATPTTPSAPTTRTGQVTALSPAGHLAPGYRGHVCGVLGNHSVASTSVVTA